MVLQTAVNFFRHNLRNRGPDPFWKKKRIFSLSGHLYGRHRSCYKFAVRGVLKTLKHCTVGRKRKISDLNNLKRVRIDAGAREHDLNRSTLTEGIQRCLILLNRKILADLAIWEPRTFKALTDVAKAKLLTDGDVNYEGLKTEDVSHFVKKSCLCNK